MWHPVRSHYNEIFAKLCGDIEAARAMGKLLSQVGGAFASSHAAAELEHLFAAHKYAAAPPPFKSYLLLCGKRLRDERTWILW